MCDNRHVRVTADRVFLRKLWQYAGHVARFPAGHPLFLLVRYRTLSWWRHNCRRPQRFVVRHARPGAQIRWEGRVDTFCNERGINWLDCALDRQAWAKLEDDFVDANALPVTDFTHDDFLRMSTKRPDPEPPPDEESRPRKRQRSAFETLLVEAFDALLPS